MHFIDNDNSVFIDVDQTLIDNMTCNLPLINKIREWKDSGKMIILWTSNAEGSIHALKAAYYCNIEDYIDYVMAKPHSIVDDDHLEYYKTMDPETLKWR